MHFTSDKEIEDIALGVIRKSLPKASWTHAAHFAAALWILQSPEYEAFRQMPDLIRGYNEATGVANTDTDGYHETITLASLKAAQHILKSSPKEEPLYEVANTLMESKFGKSDWLLDYWSKKHLFSVKARRKWVDLDLANFPF